jgi:hypothetical protein
MSKRIYESSSCNARTKSKLTEGGLYMKKHCAYTLRKLKEQRKRLIERLPAAIALGPGDMLQYTLRKRIDELERRIFELTP